MDIQQIKQLIKLVEKSDIGELELIEEGRKIRITKTTNMESGFSISNGGAQYFVPQGMPSAPQQSVAESAPSAAESEATTPPNNYIEVRSPMVGTFYRSPSPDADAYVEVGSTVQPGKPLCIIEAMKLMNEIQAEHSGRIAKIMVENSQPVEYNQVLFLLEK